ncbi:MAG: HAD hydrolase-like protein, partial [Rhodoferax sp.]|nr:HAD hydrolase-like protein [Rhodoferax sp.]
GSRTDVVKHRLQANGLDKYFVASFGEDASQPLQSKGPAHFELILECSGLNRQSFGSRTAMIGDGPHDMKIAQDAGILAIGITSTVSREKLLQAGADCVVESLDELTNLFFSVDASNKHAFSIDEVRSRIGI